MTTYLRALLRRAIRHFGFDVVRYRPDVSESAQLCAMLRAHDVNLVYDVGANIGQFGTLLRNAGYAGRIVSFEPLRHARTRLLKASRMDPHWEIAPELAVGDHDATIEINISANSFSSSVLGLLPSHLEAAPDSRYVGQQTVDMRKLDTIAPDYLRPDSVLFLKIDTQGYEDRVLNGAERTLERASGVQLELSLVPLYSGQHLFDELRADLERRGFVLWALTPAFTSPTTGRLLQVDATFFRQPGPSHRSDQPWS